VTDDKDDNGAGDVNIIQIADRQLNLHDIPFLQGAMEAPAAQIFSSLQPENYKHAHHKEAILFGLSALSIAVRPSDC